MSYESEYYAKRKKKKNDIESGYTSKYIKDGEKESALSWREDEEDIAPVREDSDFKSAFKNAWEDTLDLFAKQHGGGKKSNDDDDERTWFRKGGLSAFDDGFQGSDLLELMKTGKATERDLITDFAAGAVGIGEGAIDTGAYLVGGIGGLFGADEFKEKTAKFIAKDIINEQKVGGAVADFALVQSNPTVGIQNIVTNRVLLGKDYRDNYEDYSVLGEKSDSLVQSGGQLAATIGLQSVGVPWYVTTGVTSFGGEVETAFNEGATYGEAGLSGVISAGADILTEKLFAGSGLGEKGLIKLDGLTKGIANKTVKRLLDFGLDVGAEGLEEPIAGFFSRLGTALYKEENLKDILFSEEALDQYLEEFIGGAFLGGGMNSVNLANSIKKKTDYRTGLNANEEKVLDEVYNKELEKAKKDGKKLTKKDETKIYEDVMRRLERGEIDTATIEELLGGEDYAAYKTAKERQETDLKELAERYEGEELQKRIDSYLAESKLGESQTKLSDSVKKLLASDSQTLLGKKGNGRYSYLAESYVQKSKRGQAFTADLTQVEEKYRNAYKKAVESGILNDTRKTHDFVDLIAKISAEKGVSFDFTNNAKIAETGFAVEGKTVNGYVDGDTIGLNIDSHKALQKTVGHEISHVLEGTELFDTFQKAAMEYAKSKKATDSKFKTEYDERMALAESLYQNVEGYQGADGMAKIRKEVTADLVGDYIFTDEAFVRKLSTENRNVFEKMYDEIKYLCKVATAGSKEARELEKVKHLFETVYRGETAQKNTAENSGVKHSLSGINKDGIEVYETSQEIMDLTWDERKAKYLDDMKNEYRGRTAKFVRNGHTYYAEFDQNSINKHIYGDDRSSPKGKKALIKAGADGDVFDLVENSQYDGSSPNKKNHTKADYFDYFVKTVQIDGKVFDLIADVEKNYGVDGGYTYTLALRDNKKIKASPAIETSKDVSTENAGNTFDEQRVPQNAEDVNTQFSLSEDNVADYKQKQLDIVLETNPMLDDYHQGIRTIDDIRTWEEVLELDDESEGQFVWGDFSRADAEQATKDGTITVYSSYPIKNGVFVSTSYVQAQEYAGGKNGKVYSKTIPLTNVAWINGDEGQYAEVKKYSLSEDNQGNKLSPAVQKRFANSKVVDENGDLKVVYHGTASGEFTIFDKAKGSVEGDFGSGFYFTDSEYDAEDNYEGGGPDFYNKVARRAEQIEAEEDIEYSKAEDKAFNELYVGRHKFKVYLNIENPAIVGETNLLDYDSFAEEYDRNDYDTDEDYEADVEYLIQDKIDEILWDIEKNVDIYSTDGIAEVLWNAVNEGGIGIEQLKANIANLYLEDNNGNIVGGEVTRQIIESLGYDGIIDNTVSTKFNMDIESGTTHYIVFKPNQIKSMDNQNPTDNPDINLSLSEQGKTPNKQSNLTYGEDVKLDIAPTKETKLADDIAPMTEDEANALQDELFNSITDADAPPEFETYYDSMPDTSRIDDKALNNIGKTLRETLYLDAKQTKAIQDIVQEYSTNEMPSNDELFDTIKEKFGEIVWRDKNTEIADVKRTLRNTKINVSQYVKAGIDEYSNFRKSHSGKIHFAKDGIGVDVAYQELSEMYPDFFPADITNPADQLLRMGEVADLEIYSKQSQQIDDATIQQAVDIISREVSGYKNDLTRQAAEDTASEALYDIAPPRAEQLASGARGDALLNQSLDNYPIKTVEDKIAEKIRAVNEELNDNKVLRREAMQNYDSQIAKLSQEYASLKDKNTKKANDIVRRIARLEDLKASNDANYAKRISDLEARAEKMNDPKYNKAMHKKAKMQEYADFAKNLIGDTVNWVDKKLGLQYATNTEHRNLRDIVRDENGNKDIARADAINEELSGKYNQHEAELKRELAQIRQKYADLKISKAEDAYIQMLGELRGNPDTTLTEKVVNEYYEKHKKNIDTDKVNKVIDMARQDYDMFYSRLNALLKEQGMKEIPYRQGYFPHFTEPKQNFVQKLLNWKTQDNDIPTSIAGLTEDFKPVKSWQSFDKQRHSDETDYSFMKGFDSHSQGALDWIYHLDDIQKRRAVENYIRYTHSDEGIQARIKEVYADETLDADEAQAKIEHILADAKNPLNNFVQDFMTHTNILAGKKNSLDRAVEQGTNRHIYSVMTNVQNRMSANMVLANVRSALTNFIPITQSWAQVSPLRSLQATKDTIANAIKDDGTINKSTFLTNRLRNPDNLYNTNWDKVLDKAGIMFEVIDNFSSQVIWRSKYNDNLAKGMNESQAIKNADQFAENVMAGRSKGNEPTLFNAKNPLVKAFTMFQLEVNNQYGYLFKDAPNDLKAETKHWKLNLAKGYTTAFIGAYVYNALLEQVAGSGAALDPIGIIEDLLRDLGLFDDDEEKEPTEVVTNLVDNVVEELPFVGGFFGGGRVPISSALPYENDGLKGFIEDVGELGNGGGKNIAKEMMNPILNVGLPVGGGQIKKTVKGLSMFNTDEDHPIAGSYTDSGDLRFPVDDTFGNRIQAGIFGQWANKNAREYIDNGYAPLSPKKTQEFIDSEMPIADYWKYLDGLKGLKTHAEKADYIDGLDIEDWQKNLLMNNILDRKEDVDMSNYGDYGSYEEFDYAQKNPDKYAFSKATGGYESYLRYSDDLYDIKADKDEYGKTINGSRKEKVINYINNLDADYETKIILYKKEYPSDDTYNNEIIEFINGLDDLTYEERIAIYEELGFTVKDGYVYW